MAPHLGVRVEGIYSWILLYDEVIYNLNQHGLLWSTFNTAFGCQGVVIWLQTGCQNGH